jgi:hypothetical protein
MKSSLFLEIYSSGNNVVMQLRIKSKICVQINIVEDSLYGLRNFIDLNNVHQGQGLYGISKRR